MDTQVAKKNNSNFYEINVFIITVFVPLTSSGAPGQPWVLESPPWSP